VVGVVRRALTLLVVLTMTLSAAPTAGAAAPKKSEADRQREARKEQIKREISNLREEVEEASEKEAELLGRLDDTRDRRAELDDMVAELDDQIADVQAKVDKGAAAFDALTGEMVRMQLKLDAALAQEAEATRELRDRAVAAYINPTHISAAGAMLHANDLREIAASKGYYRAIVADRKKALDRYTALKDQTEALRGEVEKKRNEAKAQQDVVLAEMAKLEGKRTQQDAVRDEVRAEELREESVLGEIRERKAEFQAEIAALQAESSVITALLRGVQVGVAIPPGSGRLSTPIPGARITSQFGARMHPIFQEVRMHTGIDMGASAGTPIRAAADGTVVFAGARGGYGNATIIDHGDLLATLSAHQSSIFVSVGQRVTRGQVIGAVGCTGYCTGPHLHFEVRVSGAPVNPLPYF
jgi:murein DD-endopeptidase MepM/ murein hydrolase activator NlpD